MSDIMNTAVNAYTSIGKQGAVAPSSPADTGGVSFGDLLETSAKAAIDAQHAGEKMTAQSLLGKANMTDVLQAVNDAEMALNTVLAVRDRVIAAYDKVMGQQI